MATSMTTTNQNQKVPLTNNTKHKTNNDETNVIWNTTHYRKKIIANSGHVDVCDKSKGTLYACRAGQKLTWYL